MRSDRELGHKLGPRLVDLMVKATLAARKGTAPLESRIMQTAIQALIDRAGHEVADLHAPLIQPLIDHEATSESTKEILRQVASGTHQWQALAGTRLVAGAGASAISTILSNELAPAVYQVVRLNPNLNLDQVTAAQAAAAGLIPTGEAARSSAELGYGSGESEALYRLAQTTPPPDMLWELVNRGLMSEADAEAWLRRGAYDSTLRPHIMSLRNVLLSPADAALAVIRGTMDQAAGQAVAARGGVSHADFQTIVDNTGEPLGLMQLLEAFRRGFITEAVLKKGIRESRVRDEWIDTAVKLRYSPMATADAIDALLKGHIDEARAKKLTEQNGLDPADFAAMYASAGEPLALMQLLEARRRGFITTARMAEGIRQGRMRDDWIPTAEKLIYAPMSTESAIDALLKGHISEARARELTAQNGLEPSDFDALYATAGEPLSLTELLEARRRGFIDAATLAKGIRQGRMRDDWIPTAEKLTYAPMSTAVAIDAAVQGHITLTRAKELTTQNGLEPADFQAVYETAGEPLSRTEMEQLYNRGEVTAEQVKQALRESRLKDKYINDALKLHVRLPEARLIVEMITHGTVTRAEGIALLRESGYTAETAKQLVEYGEVTATGTHKALAASTIVKLYEDKLIPRTEAVTMLEGLKYSAESAGFLLQLADLTAQNKLIQQAVEAIRAAYLNHHLSDHEAIFELEAADVPPAARAQYLQFWTIERAVKRRTLTEAQIVKAFTKNMFDPDDTDKNRTEACIRLNQLGFNDIDAALLLDGA
jgi:hypothetical protein